ncbi:3-oxoacyl-ACP reductase FabG [Paenibacillus sp.]|uniref:3-oxoacyl-ACP reductase FabG n=1 Tax=Paenibacillus sp. TaxID=58172 RepID=UPI002D693C12|nr:3-oxoacyl-ACP reductase FabG [Paenibacillus sp.]HZG87804.1 3-oxoacyl-ACP reductase FabG [Paenibacillus sp.]
MRLQGKVAVITGAGNGIGLETALTFAREGARVAVAEFDAEAGEAAALRIREEGGDAAFFPVDVSDWDSVQRMAAAIAERYGRIDVLVNNAGITQDAMLSKMSVEQWRKVIDVNLDGVFYCTKAIAPYMVQQGKGKIINTSSVVGVHGNIGQTNYAATKAGVIGMTKTWAKELGFKGVNVNAVAPGYIETGMVAKVPEKVLTAMIERVPLRRLGRPADVANAYLYLASDDADYVNGTVLEVNGGLVI